MKDIIREKGGDLYIEVAHCVHCQRLTFAPDTDICGCGAELYPITRLIQLRKPVAPETLSGG